ncbi:hypothetical protein, partial [Metasolibacillus meyeri]|uniref:hypothetical protein n=1 Tax=Metasolibacillus meyeri TaxID=1071052 RepID=UPI001EE6FE4E
GTSLKTENSISFYATLVINYILKYKPAKEEKILFAGLLKLSNDHIIYYFFIHYQTPKIFCHLSCLNLHYQ